jgi:hypothetical protein
MLNEQAEAEDSFGALVTPVTPNFHAQHIAHSLGVRWEMELENSMMKIFPCNLHA